MYLFHLNLAPDQIAMLEPLGVAHNAVERLDVKGEDALIVGCGPVGLLVGMVAKAMGAKRYYIHLSEQYFRFSHNQKRCTNDRQAPQARMRF